MQKQHDFELSQIGNAAFDTNGSPGVRDPKYCVGPLNFFKASSEIIKLRFAYRFSIAMRLCLLSDLP